MNDIVGVSRPNEQGMEIDNKLLLNLKEANELIVEKLTLHDQRLSDLEDTMRINGIQELKIKSEANKSVLKALGGKDSSSYNDKSIRSKVFSAIWRDFKQHFGIPRYPELPAKEYQRAMKYLSQWEPDYELQQDIKGQNNKEEV